MCRPAIVRSGHRIPCQAGLGNRHCARGLAHHRIGGDGLVILLGDHRPPAIVGGEPQPPWTVPIHVLSRDPELVAPFLAEGYVSSLVPSQAPPHRGMETFLARFLAGFDRPG
jgi:hypothetical protein